MKMMTKEQIALDTLGRLAGNTKQSKQCGLILETLVLKDKPKKPVMIADEEFNAEVSSHLCCPACKQSIVNVWSSRAYTPRYCHYCGQKFDWGESAVEVLENDEC